MFGSVEQVFYEGQGLRRTEKRECGNLCFRSAPALVDSGKARTPAVTLSQCSIPGLLLGNLVPHTNLSGHLPHVLRVRVRERLQVAASTSSRLCCSDLWKCFGQECLFRGIYRYFNFLQAVYDPEKHMVFWVGVGLLMLGFVGVRFTVSTWYMCHWLVVMAGSSSTGVFLRWLVVSMAVAVEGCSSTFFRGLDTTRQKINCSTHTGRTQKNDDDSHKCVFEQQDGSGNCGTALSKDIVNVTGRAMKAWMCAPLPQFAWKLL